MARYENFAMLAGRVIGALMSPENIRSVEDRYNTNIRSLANSIINWIDTHNPDGKIEISAHLLPATQEAVQQARAQVDECRLIMKKQDKVIEDLRYTLKQRDEDVDRLQRKLALIGDDLQAIVDVMPKVKR